MVKRKVTARQLQVLIEAAKWLKENKADQVSVLSPSIRLRYRLRGLADRGLIKLSFGGIETAFTDTLKVGTEVTWAKYSLTRRGKRLAIREGKSL